MSANGKWAVGDAVSPANSSYMAFPRIVNTATGEVTELFTEAEGLQQTAMGANCVSDDGKTVGGSYQGIPAVWQEGKGWTRLRMPSMKYNGGMVSAITPDGKYGVGRVSIDLFNEYPCMWDLETYKLVDLPGMITSNPIYKDKIEQGGSPADWTDAELNVRITGITPDANTLIGTVDFAFPEASWEFLYRRDEAKWYPLGMKYENERLRPLNDNIMGAVECVLSSDGKYISGTCMTLSDATVPFVCPVSDPVNMTLYPDGEGYGVWGVGPDGVVYASNPSGTPIRNWSAKVGNYWYDWKTVLKQIYGIDWMKDVTKDENGLSGTLEAVSVDNLTLLACDYAQNFAYIITLPAPMTEICKNVDLLGDYSIYPPAGAEFSMLQKMVIDMGRPVEVLGEKTCVSLLDADGKILRSSVNFGVQADNNRRLEIIFRNQTLEPNKKYTVKIPAGSICIAGDSERVNKEITVNYAGRESGPVKPVSFAPDNGASVSRINLTTNPVIITFNAALSVGENPDIRLIQVKDGAEELLYSLSASVSDRQVMVYPVSEQRLAEGTDYRIDFGAGSVADLSGAGANEAFSITYHGSYVPEIDASSNTMFSEYFTEGFVNMMLYEGDHKNPSDAMVAFGFDADNTPWMPAWDEHLEFPDYAACSHSSYDPAGKSDDWMVTPQIYIPDDKATLTFKSQSYSPDKNDVLKVYVWASEDVVTILTKSLIDKIHYNGDLVYSKLQTPGKNENMLEGNWTENTVDLSKYAGKHIYIAFLNDNQNQSIVFVDDIVVSRDMAAIVNIDTPQTVVAEDEIGIKGRFIVMKQSGIKGYEVTLADADNKPIQTISSDEEMKNGELGSFSFNPVPLEKGIVNSFNVIFTSGGESIDVKYEISNLLFETTKRALLEEMTGTTCQFCPQGILATEYLEELYGDLFIPIAIHSYDADPFGGAEVNAYSSFLGLAAAPKARVDRGPVVAPMVASGADYVFVSADGLTWLQKIEESIGERAVADIAINTVRIDEEANMVSVDASVNPAINLSNANINVFGVMMEDNLFQFQTNGLFETEAPGLGEWGKGGKYAKNQVMWFYNDVVRGTSASETAGIYTGFNGKGGYIPAEIKAGEPIDFTFEFALPSGIEDKKNTKVCLILLDANSGKYINAKVSDNVSTAVEGVDAEEAAVADVFDLAGRIVMRNAAVSDLSGLEPGIYIRAGKKFIKH